MSFVSFEILISELRRKSDKRKAAIWEQARKEAGTARTEQEQKFEPVRRAGEAKIAEEEQRAAAVLIRAAEKEASARCDDARRELARRLFSLALEQLEQVREYDYGAIFERLTAELPPADWEQVRVSPLDEELARRAFPNAEIIPDETMRGGLDAVCDSGGFRVVSTLQQRLEKAWPYVLPSLLREIEEELDAGHAG